MNRWILFFTKFNNVLDFILKPFISAILIWASYYLFTQYGIEKTPILFISSLTCFATALMQIISFIEKVFEKITPFMIDFILKRRR